MDEIADDEKVVIWIGRACSGCQRPSAIEVAVDDLRLLGSLSSTDVEDAAMLACGACLGEVQCIRDNGAWALQLARAEAAATA
ncbi:hypothetical protein Sa4125_21000 [Aureimonas sp. SA4125]|uniref:hypothetical protein n=1 Tax=Aureimonas sp. SA4125 TaxID=2826993 RepID=UPI001CC65DFE|nr:hypothetical protein [Aureimonas sp. SA4125]BDA84558.1 hypothetical protein Sa4125_21000 [Aureimonas sp. SA4125]